MYHLFAVRCPDRDALRAHLDRAGIGTLVHYPVALHEQPALSAFAPAACPEAARAGRELVSLPLHPHLGDADAERVAEAVGAFTRGRVPA